MENDEENLQVIMNKEGSAVDDNFCTMFICNFRERLKLRILAGSKGKQYLVILMIKNPNSIKSS